MVHDQYLFEGSKGGEEKPHAPYETPNNLLSVAYAKVLVAVAEGELGGTPTDRDIYLDGTPLVDAQGNRNFGGVTWEWRSGRQDQPYIQGMPEVSNEISVGVEIKQSAPWVRQITKDTLSAYRVTLQWPALLKQESNGDTVGHTIDYAIDLSVDGGPFALYKQYQVSGKTNTAYERTHRVDLPPETSTGWQIRVRRITADDQSSTLQDTMILKSYAEVIDAKQRYPNTALLFVQFDSRLFGGGTIPRISVRTKGRVIRVPDNYDPVQRTYSGIWSGEFKWAYTNNPAWIFFDICTQDRFGLGKRVSANQVDKWELYEIAKYCDVMVDDGKGVGTKEPRHTYNVYIQSAADAYQVLRDVCTGFNGMSYWNGNQFVAVADKPEQTTNIPLFSRANVVDGEFSYQTTDDRSIYTSALVSYDEPSDHFGTQVEAVWEKSEILRWGGDRQTTLAAIGCTSRGQAQRRGKYTLITNMFNRTVSFKTGLQGLSEKVQPGALIGVADPLISGKAFTGRITASIPTVVTLDRETEAKAGDILYVTLSTGVQQGRTIRSVSGRVITVTTAFTEALPANAVWYLESADMKTQLFKVIRLAPLDDGQFEITGVEYNESKFEAVDNGARLEERPISKVPPSAQAAPKPIMITAGTFTEQTMAVTTMTIAWPKTDNAVLYEGEWRVGQGDWVNLGTTGAQEFNIKGIYTGTYLARVRAVNAIGIKSVWSLSESTLISGKTGAPPALTSLSVTPLVFGMRLNWAFPPNAEDTALTEVMYSKTTSFTSATKLGDFAYPQNTHDINGLAAGTTFYFWARLKDRTGNVGPYFPLTTAIGIVGKSSTDVSEYEEYFKDQITDSALGKELAEKIDKIEVIEAEVKDIQIDVTGLHKDVAALDNNVNWLESQLGGLENQLQNDITNVNSSLQGAIDVTNKDLGDLKDDVADLNDEVANLHDQVTNFVDALVYDPKKSYKKGDSVREGQKLYQALKDVPLNTAPPNAEYWKDVGDIVTDLGALSARVSTNTNTITQQGNTITAQGQKLDALTVRVGDSESKITGNTTAITSLTATVVKQGNDITTNSQAITALKGDVVNLQTGQAGNASAIESLRTTVTSQGDLITAQGQAITSLGVEVKALQTDVSGVKSDVLAQGTAITGLTTTVTQQGDTISSHSNSITSLEGKIASLTTDVDGLETKVDANSSAVSNLQNTVTQQGNKITAQGQDIVTLRADVTTTQTDINGLKTTVTGQGTAISNLQTTVIQQGKDISANSSEITKLTAELQFDRLENLYDKGETDQQIGEALNIANGAASATSSLTAEVTKQGDVINAQGQQLTELSASLSDIDGNIVGIGTAVESLKTQVTSQGNTITSQGQSITQLGNSLTLVDGKATNAKTAADKAQADATSALTQVVTKADASAVTALTTRVSNAEGAITSQGQLITQLNNSLTITNGNVTAAQQAAQAASDKAGAKGEVIYGTSAPAVDKRLPQNLWIDTTNGNNTPKRWDGSNWTAVTDKVATDAAAAAANALAVANTKADSSALQALSNTVTQQDGKITAQGQLITNLTANLKVTDDKVNLKADASTVQALTNTVTQQGTDIAANAGAITNLKTEVQFQEIDDLYKGAETEQQIGEAIVIASGAASAVSSLTSSVDNLDGKITAQGNDIVELNASLSGINGAVIANGNAIQKLSTTVTAQGNTLSSMSQSIVSLNNSLTVTDGKANTALANANNALTQVSTKADASAVTALTNRVTSAEGKITSQGESITQLNNSLTIVSGKADNALEQITHKADSSVVDSLTSTVTQQGNTLTAQATQITGLTTKVDNNTAAVQTVSQATATLTDSVANMQTSVQAIASGMRDDDGSGDLAGALESWNSTAKFSSDVKVLANADRAMVEKTDTLEASLNDAKAAVQVVSKAQADLDGKASAMWAVKLQVNSQGQYVAAGVGLGIENGPAGLQSTFLVSADKFAVVNGLNETLSTPFVVQGGQVFMKDAFIQNGSINMLKIGDNLQSDDYIAGVSGWRLSKGGNIEFNGTVAGGGRLTMTNQLIQVFDTNNVLRVRMGIWG